MRIIASDGLVHETKTSGYNNHVHLAGCEHAVAGETRWVTFFAVPSPGIVEAPPLTPLSCLDCLVRFYAER